VKEPAELRQDFTSRRLPVASLATVRAHAAALIRAHRSALTRVVLWHAAAALAALTAPWVIGQLVEEITHARRVERVNTLVLVLATGLVAQTALTWFARRAAFVLAEEVFARIREDFVASTVRLPLSVVERAGTGDLVARTTGDVDALAFVVRQGIPNLIVAATTILVTVVAALVTAPLAVLAYLVAPVVLWNPVRVYLRRALPGYRWERATYARVAGVAAETVHGLVTIDALGRSGRREAAHRDALGEAGVGLGDLDDRQGVQARAQIRQGARPGRRRGARGQQQAAARPPRHVDQVKQRFVFDALIDVFDHGRSTGD